METAELQTALRAKVAAAKRAQKSHRQDQEQSSLRSKNGLLLPPIQEAGSPKTDDKEVKELERRVDRARVCVRELKQKEMRRVSREFIENAYGRQFGVSQRDVVASLIGEEDLRQELDRQAKDLEVHRKHQAEHATFHFGKFGDTELNGGQRASTTMRVYGVQK